MKIEKIGLIVAALAVITGGAFYAETFGLHAESGAEALAKLEPAVGGVVSPADTAITLTDDRKAHILKNHKYGSGVACKSEFPAAWSDEKIIETLTMLAANDNLAWKQEDNGYFAGEQDVDGITVRAVVNRDEHVIVTGYPVSVERNPCPAREPANDNEKPASAP